MAIIVERRRLTWMERTYLPQIVSGLWITLKNLFKPKVTLEYPEQAPILPPGYRGAPTLVMDSAGREKCVSRPGLQKEAPKEFEINMLRCIFCGYCEEACPEKAIVLQQEFSLNGRTRAEMIRNKKQLYEAGGVLPDKIKKWKKVKDTADLEGGSH